MKTKLEIKGSHTHYRHSILIVLCGIAFFAYKRKDGVFVVSIACLKE